MIRIDWNVRVVSLAVVLVAPACAQSGTWSRPVALSTGGQGFEAAAAIDGTGRSIALWDERTTQDDIWSRERSRARSWGPVAQVSPASPGLQTTYVFPALRISAVGFATAVWTDSNGVWTADRPPAAGWNPSQLLLPGASGPLFVMNAKGDAAIAWTIGGPTDPHSTVMAVLRPAGGAWTAPQTVAGGMHITADHAAIGENGAVIVVWESYHAVCNEVCTLSHFVLHAARQDGGNGAWVDSGPLLSPTDDSHDGRPALDAAGRALLVALDRAGAYVSATQGVAGGAWGQFHNVVNTQSITLVSDLLSDNAGNTTFVYETIGLKTSQAYAVSGSIQRNAWSPPVLLSGSDNNVSQVYFAVASSGAGLAIWLSSSPTPKIHAVVRPTATGSWSGPVTISRPVSSELGPEAAAVNSSGNAIVIYSGYNSVNAHIEYAVNYQP